mmetsp:Transcript_16908/g.33746  ORF Transcript_16908/g.33746 Transcript_16908/m.33746 type:complete len:498 (-) Transcript_16908:4-1497(-)
MAGNNREDCATERDGGGSDTYMHADNNNELPRRVPINGTGSSHSHSNGNGNVNISNNNVATSRTTRHAASKLEVLLFFFCGLGSSLCYIATLSSLVYFKAQYGNESYIYLNLAIYLPLLPVSIAQARYDQDVDRIVGSFNAYLCRGVVGFALSVVALMLIPQRYGLGWVCTLSALIGTSGAILQGILYQMSSFVSTCSTSSGHLKAAVAAGIQASALLCLAVSILTGFGSSASDTQHDLRRFNYVICIVETLISGLFFVLMGHSRRVHTAMLRRDSSLSLVDQFGLVTDGGDGGITEGDGAPLLLTEDLNVEGFYENERSNQAAVPSQSVELTYPQLWRCSSRCCVSLLLTLVPSFLVASWFTKVKTDFVVLPQVLFYCRIISDFASRLLTLYKAPSSQRELLMLSGCRLILVVLFFVNAMFKIFPHRDALSVCLVCTIAFGSGYLVTGAYQLAPTALPIQLRERNVTKQAAFLNLAFSVSALLGLFLSLSLAGLGL